MWGKLHNLSMTAIAAKESLDDEYKGISGKLAVTNDWFILNTDLHVRHNERLHLIRSSH